MRLRREAVPLTDPTPSGVPSATRPYTRHATDGEVSNFADFCNRALCVWTGAPNLPRLALSHRPSHAHRSAMRRIRSVTTPVCDRYERPPLAGVGSAPVACCCGCAAGQLAACLPRQWSVHAPSCAVPARRLRGEAVVGRRFGRQVVGPACSGAVHASYAYCARWSWPWLAAGDLRRVSGGRDTQP